MNSDDHVRNSHSFSSRKPGPVKGHGYSPSSNYNYGNSNAHGNTNSHGNHGNSGGAGKPFHRKPGGSGSTFKRDSHGPSDKLIKQNDMIIALLKEIRDRLPEPLVTKKELSETAGLLNEEIDTIAGDVVNDSEEEIGGEEEEFTADSDHEGAVGNLADTYEVPDDDELDNKVNGNY